MKILRKINKGLMLTVIVIACLIVYLIGVESQRNKEKPNIDEAVKEYVALINKFAVLPTENQKLYKEQLTEEEKEKIKDDLEKAINGQVEKYGEELKNIMIDNDMAVNIQKSQFEDIIYIINGQGISIATNLNKEVTKIKNYTFDDDQVTVVFDSEIELETKYLENDKELTNKKEQKHQGDVITLQLVDDTWKVVYADLQYYIFDNTMIYNF